MGRRASSSINPSIFIFIALGCLILVGAAIFLFKGESGGLEKAASFPAEGFQKEGGRMYAGNEFLLSGILVNRHLEGSKEVAIFSVDTERGKISIPVSIPPEAKNINIERNSNYDCLVVIDTGGMPVAREIRNR